MKLNDGINEAELLTLEEHLMTYLENGSDISIHYHHNKTVISESIVLDRFEVSVSGLYLEGGWYQCGVESTITNVEYIEDEDSIYIEFEDGTEMNIDLNE